MAASFYEHPILNSPYAPPSRYHALDADGQPLDVDPVEGRRPSKFITPVPKSKKRRARPEQKSFVLGEETLSTGDQEYNPTNNINEIRQHVASWRDLRSPADWGVTPTTARLLQWWRRGGDEWEDVQPFFCQVEALETIVWLTEVARREKRYAKFWQHIEGANAQANPELLRIAMKMATGTGKTTVMAIIIAWQTLNAVRHPGSKFSRAFLVVAPGITIKDRLRVLQPGNPGNYFSERQIVPPDLLGDIGKAKIVITNYHAFKHRETMEISKVGRSLLQGRGEAPETLETDGQMLKRACGELLAMKNIVVINDEAHHCYRHKVRDEEDEEDFSGDEREEAKKNNEAARLWISGLEALKRSNSLGAVYDLSATPFFLRGSGYVEGTLFPWTVSDYSLMDAIESGIVKLPRVPVADNLPGPDEPIYRNLWAHIGKSMPKKGRGKSGTLDPHSLPILLQTALKALYGQYERNFALWEQQGIDAPPVFIVVCNNTASSQLVYEWISGWEREEEGERRHIHDGNLALFRNYDSFGHRFARPNTILIDSEQLESGEALDPQFREIATHEIDLFKREKAVREGAAAAEKISESDLLREVMNTVGKKGKLGEQIRCVVSVAMLTEGWDTNTVTHILGVRAFGTQLLCEQVVGRALRRQSYDENEDGLFDVEYADIMGIPFDFAAKPVVVNPKPPKPTVRVQAIREREKDCEIVFPRVDGYRFELPDERIVANFSANSRLVLTPLLTGPCEVRMEGIVGEGIDLNMETFESVRPSTITFHLAKHLLYTHFRSPGEDPPLHLFGQIQRVVRQWLEGGWLVCTGGTKPGQVLYQSIANTACGLIYDACHRSENGERRVKAILDAYNPKGSTRHVNFTTSRKVYKTDGRKCHVNYVVLDSDWEAELARVLEKHPRVLAYVKNQGLQFEVPYAIGGLARKYLPDFIARVDVGGSEPLQLVLETKGYRRLDAQVKASTMESSWVPGVNNLGTFGRWAFAEFTEVFEIEAALGKLIDGFVAKKELEDVA